MELKTKFQYTYFIHTFLIGKSQYEKYISRMLKDEKYHLKIFSKESDVELYSYFNPRTRNFLFKTFDFNKERMEKFEELPFDTKSAIIADLPCVTFDYDIEKNLQGKTIDENSIFFKIQKLSLVCFNTGICFLALKTNIEESNEFADVLNFNYKFRDINKEYNNNYDDIKLQADYFEDMQEIKDFITNITGPNFDALKIDLNVDRFYTFSYTCIDQADWNVNTTFENIKSEFFKYIEILPNNEENIEENSIILSNSKFSKIGISKQGVNLFSSDADEKNYTLLPKKYENQYFYSYILALYNKVYMKKLDYDFKIGKNIDKTRKEFVFFTKNIWVQEATSDNFGSLLYQDIKKALEVEEQYEKIKNKYDILYRELKIEKSEKRSIFIAIVLVITLILNILNWLGMK